MCAALVRFAELSWRLALVSLLFLTPSALTSCAARLPSAPAAAPIVLPLPDLAGDVWKSRGHVVHQEPYDDPPLDNSDSVLGHAWRAVYTSVSGVDGGIREVSGAFFVPSGTPPENGWPVISLGHGTTGVGNNCGPSRQPHLQGYAPWVQALLADKYAVALSDYEGLGESGSHPYLEPRTAAFNIIDAVRALREISPTVAARWMAVGYSQGGQAAWAANELNSYYGDDLQLQGSIALAPAANVTGLADLAWSGSLTKAQRARYPLGFVGLARYNPDLDLHSFLHGSAEVDPGQLSCHESIDSQDSAGPQSVQLALELRNLLRGGGFGYALANSLDDTPSAGDLKPDTPQDVAKLRDALRRVALPQRPLDKSMLVINGEQDTIVLPEWVQSAVSRSCALGGRIEYQPVPDANHLDLIPKVAYTVQRWVADRFAGTPAQSNCPAEQK